MNDLNDVQSINEYKTEWSMTDKGLLTNLADDLFFGIDKTLGKFQTLDEERAKMLEENPDLKLKPLTDGFDLEVDRLNAIRQKSSKGLQIFDINPGFLDPIENALTLPFEFIFDGTGFLPSQNDSITKNFRTVNIPIAGNFCKIEFIYENNNLSNAVTVSGKVPPVAGIKYAESFGDPLLGELDLITNQTSSSFDQFARNKVWVDFGQGTGKPHLVPSSGRIFKTYFSEINVSLNLGAPKIRVTIGSNSEVVSDQNYSAINSRLSLAGSGRILADIDTALNPFCITENDINGALEPGGISLPVLNTLSYVQYLIAANNAYTLNQAGLNSIGYSVFWITRIRFQTAWEHNDVISYIRPYLFVGTGVFSSSNPTQQKRIHNFKMMNTQNEYIFNPVEPIRVVIPSGSQLYIKFALFTNKPSGNNVNLTYAIDGYSLGEFLQMGIGTQLQTSKFLTDSTFLTDFNRISNLKD